MEQMDSKLETNEPYISYPLKKPPQDSYCEKLHRNRRDEIDKRKTFSQSLYISYSFLLYLPPHSAVLFDIVPCEAISLSWDSSNVETKSE